MGSCVFVQLNFCFGRKIFVCFAFFFFPLSLSVSLSLDSCFTLGEKGGGEEERKSIWK